MQTLDLDGALLRLSHDADGPLLALDAATAQGSLCLVDATQSLVCELVLSTTVVPSDSLAESIARTLAEARLTVAALRAIVVGLGPGSFTGLRVALATVKGMAFATGVPVYGTSSLGLIAATVGRGTVVPVLDARRGEVFSAIYEVGAESIECILEDAARSPEMLIEALRARAPGEMTLVGDAAAAVGLALGPSAGVLTDSPPRAAAGLLRERQRILARAGDPLAALVPRYMRVSEAERQLERRQLGLA